MNFFKKHAALLSVFFIGFASLLYQTYAIHVVFQFFPKGSDMVALSVAAFLSGLGLSALLFSKISRNNVLRAKNIVILSQIVLIFLSLFFYMRLELFESIIIGIEKNLDHLFLRNSVLFTLIWLYLFTPAMLLGGCFPVIIALHQKDFDKRFEETGTVYFYDIFGAVLGSLITGFYLIPYLGLETTIFVACITSIAAISLLIHGKKQWLGLSGFVVFLVFIFLFPFEKFYNANQPEKSLPSPSYNVSGDAKESAPAALGRDSKFGNIIFRKTSHYGTVTVGEYNGVKKKLFINHRKMCVVDYKDEHVFDADGENLLALIALSNIKGNGEVINVGLGCGMTATLTANHPHTKKFDLVEINPAVVEAYKGHFSPVLGNILDLDHVSLHIKDGGEYLRRTNRKFDAIIIDIEEIDVIHSLPLYTQEYFKIMKSNLKEGGVLALWSFYVSDDFSKVLYNGLQSVFPHVEFVPRVNSRGVAFFAADQEIKTDTVILDNPEERIDISELIDEKVRQRVINHSNREINTLNNPVLRKYYNSYKFFETPSDYVDPQVIKE